MKLLRNTNMFSKFAAFGILATVMTSIASAAAINRQLQYGMSGSDIGLMQSFFAKDASIYPQGLVTNYFGMMTKAAVMNFQARNGISTVGRVGPSTLPVLNAAIANGNIGGNTNTNQGTSGPGVAPYISGVNVSTSGNTNTINMSWATNEPAQGFIYYSSSPLVAYENENSVTVTGAMTSAYNNNYALSQSITLQNLQSNTVYYYLIYTTDQDGNVSVYPSTFRIN